MSLSVLARAPALRQRAFARSFQSSARTLSEHGEYNPLPFKQPGPGSKKVGFGIALGAFLVSGFSIPFLAAKYQLIKAAGA